MTVKKLLSSYVVIKMIKHWITGTNYLTSVIVPVDWTDKYACSCACM